MAKMECFCGEFLSTTSVPNNIQFSVYTDEQFQKLNNEMMTPSIDVWRCPKCERLYIFQHGKLIKQYVLEIMDEGGG